MRNFSKQPRGGVPLNIELKERLRRRSVPLTSAQRYGLKQMGVRVDKNTTEKEAAKLVKRIVNFESAYVKGYVSKWTRKRRNHKPRNISSRQQRMNVLMYREENGSKRASKQLANL